MRFVPPNPTGMQYSFPGLLLILRRTYRQHYAKFRYMGMGADPCIVPACIFVGIQMDTEFCSVYHP